MGALSREVRTTLLISLLVGCAAGCSKHVNDDKLAQDVQSKIAADPETKDAAVSVTAKDGKVTLRGTVKDTATQRYLSVFGGHTDSCVFCFGIRRDLALHILRKLIVVYMLGASSGTPH